MPRRGQRAALQVAGGPHGILPLDWNRDFKMDLAVAGRGGVRLFTQQTDGTFLDATREGWGARSTPTAFGVWTADIEMDGDLDLIVGVARRGARRAQKQRRRDSGASCSRSQASSGLRAFAWGDLDGDGDPDAALLGERGDVHRLREPAGRRVPRDGGAGRPRYDRSRWRSATSTATACSTSSRSTRRSAAPDSSSKARCVGRADAGDVVRTDRPGGGRRVSPVPRRHGQQRRARSGRVGRGSHAHLALGRRAERLSRRTCRSACEGVTSSASPI